MADNLTTLVSKVQALLGDDGTIFTTALITASARKTLSFLNEYMPVNAGTLIDAVTDQYEYELTDDDSTAIDIHSVLIQDSDETEIDIQLTFDQYLEDERVFFRLRSPQTTGETLIVRYTKPQTIIGLDSQVETTHPAWLNDIIITGIAADALQIRAFARVETINLNRAVSENYAKLSKIFKDEFTKAIMSFADKKLHAVGEPDTRAWNDPYHSWEQ